MYVVSRQLAALLALFVFAFPSVAAPPAQGVLEALAPTGMLRVALYVGSPITFIRGETPSESRGVGLELGQELARASGVPLQLVIYPTPAAVVDGLKAGEWDVTVLARTPEREKLMNLTEPFLLIEHGYLVPAGSPISAISDVDRAGVRIGAPQGGSVNTVLAQMIRNAVVVPIPGLAAAPDAIKTGQVDVFAANKANLSEVSDELPGSRILDGRIGLDEYAIALPKGREVAVSYLRQFLETAKSDGLLKTAIEAAGIRGAVAR